MSIVLVGISHKTAPVEVRESLAFTAEDCADSLGALVDGVTVREALILSTCNRVEVIAATGDGQAEEGAVRIRDFLSRERRMPIALFADHLYIHRDETAVRHLFRVAASLDSMVVGEPQVLGQVRQAYSLATERGAAGRVLHRLMHHTLRVAKRVRTETGIAASAVSISYAAVELGRKIFSSLDGRTVLLVGAGEMAELAARYLARAGAARILIANRTADAARQLAAQFGGEAFDLDSLPQYLSQADIVICSTAAPDFVITKAMIEETSPARGARPVFFIDISVPRNVDPAIGELDGFFVYDVDDLASVVETNKREREREAARAELIVDVEVEQFNQKLHYMKIGSTVDALRYKLQRIADAEYERQRHRLGDLSPQQEQAVRALIESTINKISHPVIHRLRRSYETGEAENVQAWRDSFGIEE
ncbi:MAG: glutamyl-tRNA reductase [Pyrinomonadaceae bacterium]|nr:glutamyl-tRNA reductase [Pyrinomonadaceae bacterium]